VKQAFDYLGDSVEVYLDGGPSPKGEASTILDLTGLVDSYDDNGAMTKTGKIKVIRQGALSLSKIKSVIGDLLESTDN
jgi:tRNA A37 threonylcarbamoyladenosine synthetase subunit TsaC/SUA5/YrdC